MQALSSRVKQVLSSSDMREKAQAAAAVIGAENGTKECADIIEKGADLKW
jgi:UDP:flavonoid glycosyltransferase YjiC (YdhE family)